MRRDCSRTWGEEDEEREGGGERMVRVKEDGVRGGKRMERVKEGGEGGKRMERRERGWTWSGALHSVGP